MTTLLAIDQGTTSTRALAIDPEGHTRLVYSRETRQIYPQPGWVEHDPEELLATVQEALGAAPVDTLAVGLANQGESCLAWDRVTGQALSPVIVWQDERTRGQTESLRAQGGEMLTLDRAGLPLDPYFSASKLAWLYEHTPEAKDLAGAGRLCLGTTDAFFRQHLTGRAETDLATASRTSLLSLEAGAWDQELCALFGVPLSCLPEITATHGSLGKLPGGLPFAASIVDQQAALRGHGCTAPGEVKITFGTGAFALSVAGAVLPPAGLGPLPTIAWTAPDGSAIYALDGGVYAAGAAINWARDLGLFRDYAELNAFDGSPAIGRGLVFVPALAGLACPHWDRRAKGAWLGLSLDTDRRLLSRAVLEGVALRATEVIAAMGHAAPLAESVSIDGGMSQNPAFCQFLADCLGRPLTVSANPERTALGVAALAAEALDRSLDLPETGSKVFPRAQPSDWSSRFSAAVEAVRSFPASDQS